MGGPGHDRVAGSERSAPIAVIDPDVRRGVRADGERAPTIEATAIAANDALADAEQAHRELLVFHASGTAPDPEDLNLWSFRFRADPQLALMVVDDSNNLGADDSAMGSVPSVKILAARLQAIRSINTMTDARVDTGADLGAKAKAETRGVVLRVSAMVAVGGFDPTMPGLGLADLVTRTVNSGWSVDGIDPSALPFVDDLHRGLGAAGWFRSEARWLQLHRAPSATAVDPLKTFADRTITALDLVDGPSAAAMEGSTALDINVLRAEAELQWRGPAAQEVQEGIGDRADWRFLLPTGRRDHTLIVDADPGRWSWLVDDGWTNRLSTRASEEDQADVVVVSADQPIAAGVRAIGPEGTICVLRSRRPLAGPGRGAGRSEAAELADLGFRTRRYLAIPDLHRPKRYIPLDHDGGLAWLLSTSPPEQVGGLSRSNLARRRLARLAGGEITRLTGDIVVIGQRGPASTSFAPAGVDHNRLPPGTNDVIMLTSGFDEGSRAVLLPLAADVVEPRAVIKISSRPVYNQNVDREAELIETLSGQVTRPGLLPASSGTFAVGPLRGSIETYAGRWSGSDVLNEQGSLPRRRVLDLVMGAINDLGQQTAEDELAWSADAFEAHIGHWLDRVERAVGSSSTIGALRWALAERSEEVDGRMIPLVRRHYDLGPWNVVFNEQAAEADASPVTIIDWEVAPPRSAAEPGLAGADLIYFVKYWLHIAMDLRSADDELAAFPFLTDPGLETDPRFHAADVLGAGLIGLGVDRAFVPLLAVHVWSEAAAYTIERRKRHGGDPGSPYRYLLTLARFRHRLLAAWPLDADTGSGLGNGVWPRRSGPITN